MKLSLVLIAVLPLFGCGTGVPDKPTISRSAHKSNMQPAPTPTPAGTDSSQNSSDHLAVIPPQHVIGGYVVSVLQSSASLPSTDCSVAFVEGGLTSASIVSPENITYLPFYDLQQIGVVSIFCGDGIPVAEKVLSEADRQELFKAVVANYNQDSRFVARLKVPASGQNLEIVLAERVSSSAPPVDSTAGTSTSPAGSSPVPMKDDTLKQTMDDSLKKTIDDSSGTTTSSSASSGSAVSIPTEKTPEPLKIVDTTPPVIQGTRFMESAGKRLISLIGARDDVELAKKPYSFDGGLNWIESPQGSFSMGDKIPFGTVKVMDAAGNVLNVRIVIPLPGLSKR
ncbi:MAG: hypothetical protein ACO3A4_14090 [Silvanigrellaceae bacterium]